MLHMRTDYQSWRQDAARRTSREVDYGAWWRLGKDNFPRYRVSWMRDTGELYAVALQYPPTRFFVIGTFKTRREVEERMAGWSDEFGRDLLEFFPELASSNQGMDFFEAAVPIRLLPE